MRERWTRNGLLGREIVDPHSMLVGTVVDTYPFDGGGEIELAVVRLRHLGERRMLPVTDIAREGDRLRAAFTRGQVEDSPRLTDGRHAIDDPERAKAHWRFEEPVRPLVASLGAPWLSSSGFSVTERPSLTIPSPTSSVS
jgi:hypothetical protein